jgi:bifunctional DNase/RNase
MGPLALALMLLTAGVARATGPIEVRVAEVGRDATSGVPVVRLAEKGGQRALPIWIGVTEAEAIARALRGLVPPRPLTHDLLARAVTALGAELERVEITGLAGETYLAVVRLRPAGRPEVAIDARPSDAIALALRLDRPILVNPALFLEADPGKEAATVRVSGLTVQPLTAALAEALGEPGRRGVLVAEVDPAGPAAAVRPGDVIVAVDGEPIRTPPELVAALTGRAAGARPARLEISRRGRRRLVQLRPPH